MRGMARFLIGLYPANWRARYGEEFEALVEDDPVTVGGLFDLLKGALKMQLSVPSFPKLAAVLSVVGFLVGYGVSFLFTPQYESTAAMAIEGVMPTPAAAGASPNPHEHLMRIQNEVLSRTSLSRIIQHPLLDLYPEERLRTPLEDVIETMRRDIKIAIAPAAAGSADRYYLPIEITYHYRDAKKTQQTVQTLLTRFQEESIFIQRNAAKARRRHSYDEVDRLEARIAALEKRLGISGAPRAPEDDLLPVPAGFTIQVLDTPSFPERPYYPGRVPFGWVGFSSGIGLALVVTLFRRRPLRNLEAGTLAG